MNSIFSILFLLIPLYLHSQPYSRLSYICTTELRKGKVHDGRNVLYFDQEKSFWWFSSLYGQENIRIYGQVTDSLTGAPLIQALVYLTPDTSGIFLAHTTTNEQGKFELRFGAQHQKLRLHVRYLGYQQVERFLQPFPNAFFSIALLAKEQQLNEVIVSEERPAIVKKSDTTTYEVDRFIDSTEFNVEDVLKKLPGIEVGANGSISVNGKAVDRVLVEGTDLFGRKYTLGTKNIRAGFIEKVEIIDHYQENPVLKNVNTSDAVVLNLLLREDKKNVLSGTWNAGLGAGVDGELKAAIHLNIFSISKHSKAILLSDNGNTGAQYNRSEIDATYGNPGTEDWKDPIREAPDFQQWNGLQNPGLPREFVDNSLSLFSTARSSFQLNERWTLNVNGLLSHQNDRQDLFSEQAFFLEENAYRLRTERLLSRGNHLFGADAQLQYLSERQDRSFQGFAQWNASGRTNRQYIDEWRGEQRFQYETQGRERPRDWFFAGLFTQKTGENSVLQVQGKSMWSTLPQWLNAANRDFPLLIGADSSFIFVNQSLRYEHRETELSARYIWTKDQKILLELEPVYARSFSRFANHAGLGNGAGAELPLFVRPGEAETVSAGNFLLNLHLRTATGPRSTLSLYLQGRQRRNRLSDEETVLIPTYSGRALWQLMGAKGGETRFSYGYRESNPESEDFFSTPYLEDNYSLQYVGRRDRPAAGHFLQASYRRFQTMEYRSYYLDARYEFGRQIWRSAADFEQSLVLSSPFFATQNRRLSLRGSFDQFFPKLKTNLKLTALLQSGRGDYLLLQAPVLLSNRSMSLNTSLSTVALRHFQLIADNQFQDQLSFPSARPQNGRNQVFSWRSAFTAGYHRNQWRLSASLSRTLALSGNSRADLLGVQMRASKTFTVRNKPMMVELILVNLLHARRYATVLNDAYFFFQSAVPAVPAFLMMRLDYGM